MTIRNRFREIRHQRMIDKKQDMAALLGISPEQYSRHEAQKIQPSLEKAFIYAKKLKLPVHDLFYLVEDNDEPSGE